MSARVFVPLVGADGSAQHLFEALAGATAPEPHPAKLTPQISELFDFGLYKIGQSVREAVTRFSDIRRGRVWFGRRNARIEPWHLRISDLQVGRLSDENARSAGFGLVLAALLQAFNRPHDVVFATGELILPQAPGTLDLVTIGPVSGIRGKLSLVGDYIHQHRAQLSEQRIKLLLPKNAVDGGALAETEERSLARLKEAAGKLDLKLDIHFIGNLDEIDEVFGTFSAEPIVGGRSAALLAALLVLGVAFFAGYNWIVSAPVRLSWQHVEQTSAQDPPEPRRAIYQAETDNLQVLPACFDTQRQPVVEGGETLLLKVAVSDERPLAHLIAPPRFFIASVSRSADPIVLDTSLFKKSGATASPNEFADVVAIPVERTEDEVRLFVVATRDQTVSLSQFTDDLRSALEGVSGAAVLATASQFMKDRFDGLIDYQFRVTTDASLCTP